MSRPVSYFGACLAALLMLGGVPANAADVKDLFAITVDRPGFATPLATRSAAGEVTDR